MTDFASFQGRIAGVALLASFLSLVVGFVIVAVQRKLRGLSAAFLGVEGAGDASGLATLVKAAVPYTLFQLAGFGVLVVMLIDEGEAALSMISYGLLVFALAISVFKGVFEGTVTVWAANQWEETGTVPEFYEPLHEFVDNTFRVSYVTFLVAMAGFGWAVLSADLLAPWVGWLSIGWSGFWFVGYFVSFGIPPIVFIYPLIYGIALVLA